MQSFLEYAYRVVSQYPRKLLWSLVLITVVLGYGLQYTRFSHSYNDFLPNESPEYQQYRQLIDTFGTDNDFVFITAASDNGIFNKGYISQIRSLTKKLKALPQTNDVVSLTSIFNPVLTPTKQLYKQYYIRSPRTYQEDSLRIVNEALFNGFIISKNKKETALFVKHKAMEDVDSANNYLSQIETITSAHQSSLHIRIVGKIRAQRDLLSLMKKEFQNSILLICSLVILLLWVIFRSVPLTLSAAVVIIAPMVWLLGIIAYTGKSLNVISLILPAIVLTIGTSDIVHIITHYKQVLHSTNDKKAAMHSVITKLGLSTFLTSITTCLGFLSLNNASLVPVQNMGNHAAIGVLLAFICAFVYFPCIIILLSKPAVPTIREQHRRKLSHKIWNTILWKLFSFSLSHKKLIIMSTLIAIVASIIGISRLHTNTYLLEDVREKTKLKQDFVHLDTNFTGIRAFEVIMTLKDNTYSFDDKKILTEIDTVSQFIKDKLTVGYLISPSVMVKKIYRSLNKGEIQYEKLPDSMQQILPYLSLISDMNSNYSVLSKNRKLGRISGKMPDVGSEKGLNLRKKFQNYLKHNPPKYLHFTWTGSAYMVDLNNQLLVKNMIRGFLISALLIGISIFLMMRSIKLSVFSIILNSVPILITAGIMGFCEVRIRLVTIIVFAVAFGISIDNLIHFLARYKIELKRLSPLHAIKHTFLSTGRAIITSNTLLIIGFASLVFSNFEGIATIGIFIALPLFIGMISVLTLIPILLYTSGSKLK